MLLTPVGICVALLVLVTEVLCKAKRERDFGNYDFQLGFHSGLKEVFVTKDFDSEYADLFSEQVPMTFSLIDRVDTCDLSRYAYSHQEYFIPKGTMAKIFKNKKVKIGYVKGLDVLGKFELDMYVEAIRHMIRYYNVLEKDNESDDTKEATVDYSVLKGDTYTAGIEDDLNYGKENNISIIVEEIVDFTIDNNVTISRNYDLLVGMFPFVSKYYNKLLTNADAALNDHSKTPVMFGCNTMRIDLVQMCLKHSSGISTLYAIRNTYYGDNVNDKFQVSPVDSYGILMGKLFENYQPQDEPKACGYIPRELAIFTKKRLYEVCMAYNKNTDNCNEYKASDIEIDTSNMISYRVAPLFNLSLPISDDQDKDAAILSTIIDSAMEHDGNLTSDDLTRFISLDTSIPKLSTIIIPYQLEYILSTYLLGISLNYNGDNEFLSFNSTDSTDSNETYSVENANKEYLGSALVKLSNSYGRNIQGCSCEYKEKYTKLPLAYPVTVDGGENKKMDGIFCNKPDDSEGYVTSTRKALGKLTSDNLRCQIAYSGIVWKNDYNKLDTATTGSYSVLPGIPYHSERLVIWNFHLTDTKAADCPENVKINEGVLQKEGEFYYVSGTGVENFVNNTNYEYDSFSELEKKIDDDYNKTFLGYEPQMEIIEKMLKKYISSLGENNCIEITKYNWNDTRASQPNNTYSSDKFYSRVNFVNVYNMGGKSYEINNGVVDNYARILSKVMMIITIVIVVLSILVLAWRIIRITCGGILPSSLRHLSEKFAKKRDEEWYGQATR